MIRIFLPVLVTVFIFAQGIHTHGLFHTDNQEVHTYIITQDGHEQEHRLCLSCLSSVHRIPDNRSSELLPGNFTHLRYSPGDFICNGSLIYQNTATRAPPMV